MSESGQDAFNEKTPKTGTDAEKQGDGDSGKQTSASSGTTPLTGEPRDQDSIVSPGGVEGVRENT